MEESMLGNVSPVYGFSNRAGKTGRLNKINTEYDRSLEQAPLDQYEAEAAIAKTQPEIEKKNHTWLGDSYTNFLNKKNEIQLMSERAKIVNEIDPELNNVIQQLNSISDDDPLKDRLESKKENLLNDKQNVLDEIGELETELTNRKIEKGISAHYQVEEAMSQDKSLRDLDYWAYSVPGTMGSSFSDMSSYAAGFASQAIRIGAAALAGTAVVASGGTLLPAVIAGAGTALATGVQIWGVNKSNRSESLAETYGAYKDRVNSELNNKGLNLQAIGKQARSVMPEEEANKYTDDQIADKLLTGEIQTDNQDLLNAMNNSKKNLDYVYNRNRALVVTDHLQNVLTFGAPFGLGSASKLITKPIKAVMNTTKLGSKAVANGEKLIDNVIGWNTKIALKNPVSKGLTRIPKNLAKYGLNAISEGFEEGSQNIFNRDYLSGKYDEESSNFLKSYGDLIGANYRVAKILSGIDTESELAKDPDFWNEVKGGVALGLFMGAGPQAYTTTVGTAKEIAANRTVRDLTADNLSKKDLMNRVGVYSQKASKRLGNYDEEIINLLEGFKHTNLPEGVTSEDVDNEIKLAKEVQRTTKDKAFNNLAKAAEFEKGSREYNAFLGLRHLAKVDTTEATENFNAFKDKYEGLVTDYLSNPAFNLYPDEERDAIKQKMLSTSLIDSMQNWLTNIESTPEEGKRKYGILDSSNPLTKVVLNTIKSNLLKENIKLKQAESLIKDEKGVMPEPSKELVDAYIGSLLAESDFLNSSENTLLLNSEKQFKSLDEEGKQKIASKIKAKVNEYLNNVDDTEKVFDETTSKESDTETEPSTEEVLPTPEDKPVVIPDAPASEPTPETTTTTTTTTASTETPTEAPETTAEEGTPSKGETTSTVGTGEVTIPETTTESESEPTTETVSESEPEVSEGEPLTPFTETTKESETEPVIETPEAVAVNPVETTEDAGKTEVTPEKTELPVESPLNSSNVDERLKKSDDFWKEVEELPQKKNEVTDNDELNDATKVLLEIESRFDDLDGLNSKTPENALAISGLNKRDKVSNTMFYSPKSKTPLLPGYETGEQLARLLETPGILNKCYVRFFINESYTEQGYKPYVKGDQSTYDGASLFIELQYNGKKYIMYMVTPNTALKLNPDTVAIQRLQQNRNAIISALENADENTDIVPVNLASTNGLYNQNTKIVDGNEVVVHRSVSEIKGFNIPEDPFQINKDTVDIAIGRGLRGEPPFSLFDANMQERTGRGGSGQIFYMANPKQTLSGKELPIQLNLSRFGDALADFIYNIVIKYGEGSGEELTNADGSETFATKNEILENMVQFGQQTFVPIEENESINDSLTFLREKQFGYSDSGLLFVGTKAYNSLKITPAEEAEIKNHIKGLHWKVDKDTFWKPLNEVFKSVQKHFDRTDSTEIEVIPGFKFTREQFDNNMTLMGWMISNNLLSCDLKDTLFTDAFNYFNGIASQKNDGKQEKLSTQTAVSTQDTITETTEQVVPEEEVIEPNQDTTVSEPEAILTEEDKLTPEEEALIKEMEESGIDFFDPLNLTMGIDPNDGRARLLSLMKKPNSTVSSDEIQWFKDKLGLNGEDIELRDHAIALGNDVYAMGLCKLYSTVLWKSAEEGTLYHEAFHKVSLLLLSPKERQQIYTFYRNAYKSEASDEVIEEALAEEFRSFMLHKVNTKLNIVNRMFNAIKNFINKWFNRSEYGITKLFEQINSGYYSDKSKNKDSVNDWLNTFKTDGAAPFVYKGVKFTNITNVQVEEIVKSLSSFALIYNNVRYSGDVSKINLDKVKAQLSPAMNSWRRKKGSITPQQAAVCNEIYNNFDSVFAPLILNGLKTYKIKTKNKNSIDEETETKASGDETGDEMAKYTKQSFEISAKSNALPEVRMMVGCLVKMKFDENNPTKLVPVLNQSTGLAVTVDFDRSWNRIANAFANCNEFSDMLNEANKRSKQDPLFASLASTMLGLTKINSTDTPDTLIAKENLKTQIRNTFRKHKANYIFCSVKDTVDDAGSTTTEVILKDENKNKIIKQTLTGWLNNFVSDSPYIRLTADGYKANNSNIDALKDSYEKMKNGAIEGKLNDTNLIASKQWVLSTLAKLGVSIDMQTLNNYLIKYYDNPSEVNSLKEFLKDGGEYSLGRFINYKLKDVKTIKNDGTFKSGKFKTTLDKLYNTSRFLQRLVLEHAELHPDEDELGVHTSDNKMFYSITENNYFFDFTDELNSDRELIDKLSGVMYNGGDNSRNTKNVKGSIILNALRKGGKLMTQTLIGFKREGANDPGRAYSEISPLEDYVMKVALTRANKLVLPTMGDSVSYSVLSGSAINMLNDRINTDTGISYDANTLDRFSDYFETEIDTISFNYDNLPTRPQDIIENYDTGNRNGYKFRYFNQIVDGIDYNEDLAAAEALDKANNDPNYTQAKKVIAKIKDEWYKKTTSDKRKIINNYLMRRLNYELKNAAKIDLIKFDGNDLMSVENVNIPSSMITEVTDKRYSKFEDKASTFATLDIVMNFVANHIMSEIEFTKLYNKDPAYYKTQEDLLKRRREVFSTGITPAQEFDDPDMNALKDLTVGTFRDNEIVSRQIKSIMESASKSYAFNKLRNEYGLSYADAKQAIESKDSKYTSVFDEADALAANRFRGYEKVNQTDATVLLSPEGYKQLVRRTVGWKPEVAKAFEILNDASILTEENSQLYQDSLHTILAPLKCMFFGGRYNDELKRDIPIFDKMALFPVFPVFATGDMKAVLDRMTRKDNPIHMIAFESAVKTGQDSKSYMYDPKTGLVDEESINNIATHKQPLKYFRKQMVTDPHDSAHDQMLVSQAFKAALLNVRPDNQYTTPKGDSMSGSSLFERLFSCVNKLTAYGSAKVEKEFGVKERDGVKTASTRAVYSSLRNSAEASNMNQNVIEGLTITKDKPIVPLSGMSDNPWVEAALLSSINKEVIDINTPGGMFIQMSSVAYNDLTVRSDKGVRDLKFDNADGTVECVVSINLLKQIIPDYDKMSFVEAKKWLITHEVIGRDKPAMAMGYRIPAQGPSSVAALKIVDVYPENIGDTITLPDEWTALTGSDRHSLFEPV